MASIATTNATNIADNQQIDLIVRKYITILIIVVAFLTVAPNMVGTAREKR
jgi:hypothetical protein